jgi:hypothetical protein
MNLQITCPHCKNQHDITDLLQVTFDKGEVILTKETTPDETAPNGIFTWHHRDMLCVYCDKMAIYTCVA